MGYQSPQRALEWEGSLVDAIVRTQQVTKPTHVTLTMTWDEAQALFPFLGKIDLHRINSTMDWGTHTIKFGPPTKCTCGKDWPCPDNEVYQDTGEAVFQVYAALDVALRKYDYEN